MNYGIDAASGGAADALRALFGEATTGAIFSDPEQVGDDTVILASAWERAGGFGFGSGGDASGGGAGAGGGGASEGRPVAVIRVGPRGVEVKPIVDFTKIGVTILLSLIAIGRVRRRDA